MSRNPTPAQVAAALAAYDEVVGLDPRPNLRKRHAAMVAALRGAADIIPNGAENEHLQRDTAG